MTFWRLSLAVAIFAWTAPAATAQNAPENAYELIGQAIAGGRLVQARTMLATQRLSKGDEAGVEFDLLHAELALAERRDAQALAAFTDLHQRGVEDCRVPGGLGVALIRHQKAAEALGHLRSSVQACPKNWRTWNAMGIALDLARDWEGSGKAYETAFQLTDDRPAVMNNYGFSLLLQQRLAEAARLFAAASRAEPANQRYANNADIARAMAGEPLVATDNEDKELWARRLNNAGYASLLAGRAGEAKSYFSRSLHASDSFFQPASANLSAIGGGQ